MFSHLFTDYFKTMQHCQQEWWQQWDNNNGPVDSPVSRAMHEVNLEDTLNFFESAAKQPGALLGVQTQWWEKQLQIWQSLVLAGDNTDIVAPEKGDKRFADPAWQQEAWFSFIKQSYLLYCSTFLQSIDSMEGLDIKTKERLSFFSRQMLNALSPSNFVMSNPELLKMTLEQNGENLLKGLQQLQEDVDASADILKIRMTNNNAFRLGTDIAKTPGKVVYRNELYELIQYTPRTKKVNPTPLLVIPPFINKYYILDLRPENSMVNWLLEQGHNVFLISWRNPGAAQRNVELGDYVTEGVVDAVKVLEEITGQSQVNAAGYCIGGTVLAMTLAYYAAKRMKPRIKTATFFTTLLDFSQPGEVGAYINDSVIKAIETQNNAKGYLDGRSLSVTFSLLRENSLYWNYYIDNYLKGQSPVDFDLLYWNSDSTNVAANTHNFLLRELYLNNKLIDKRGVKVGGVYVDLSKISVPSYFVSTREDHIALWQGTYRGALNLGGNKTFVLGESGHIAGIVNPPAKNKYGYWLNPNLPDSAEEWQSDAERQDGSWWTHWQSWLEQNSPEKSIPAPTVGSEEYPVLADAPGDYVKQTLPIQD
ncbi:class I poly(R)-hydroxyalkanoic acid synthase [Shewanella submarina]|uniref:Class I poly(R)-hydroxyalkanoic acid synthase n=1 Tax=Shewanella submarina TaxID=2016376 RepID=A0ABV7GIV6_9GAMM|nr:class I poly(R)-hydroxyalkanoic acid synthase [Shewanella submarina]MCL1039157.1 class I poly(R)-hydroxyalkanoic acid synthase [Shewanella submarina]